MLVDAQINSFFQNATSVTREQCDVMAQEITGQPTTPTKSQGCSSYTVEGGETVVQFRAHDAALDMAFVRIIEQAYSPFTPRHEYRGRLGDLHIYVMNNMGGCCLYMSRTQLWADNYKLLGCTLDDFARLVVRSWILLRKSAKPSPRRFFASAYHNTPETMTPPNRKFLFNKYTSQLQELRQSLPERFHSKLDELIPQVPDLLVDGWPLVPNHVDLLEGNIHVDTATGRIVGICDWRETEISPFGMSLGWLETMLGRPVKGGDWWIYHPNQHELREHFWTAFYHHMGSAVEPVQKRRIEAARLIGLFLMNAIRDGKIAEEGSSDLCFLGAVILRQYSFS